MDLKTVTAKGTRYEVRRRIGRGGGSGSGKTSGRGHKGYGSRSGSRQRPGFEGGQMPIYRRVPKRGFTNARFRTEFTIVNVAKLNEFEDGTTVDLQATVDHGLVSSKSPFLKVLGVGDLSRKLTVRAQRFSKSAREKIEAAGGTVVLLDTRGREMAADAAAPAPAAEPPAAEPTEDEGNG